MRRMWVLMPAPVLYSFPQCGQVAIVLTVFVSGMLLEHFGGSLVAFDVGLDRVVYRSDEPFLNVLRYFCTKLFS